MTTPRAPSAAIEADTEQPPASAASELELYKLAVEMADRISARRALANTFFLTINTGLAALLGGKELRWYVAVAGLLFALAWWVAAAELPQAQLGKVSGDQRHRAATPASAVLERVAAAGGHEGTAPALAADGAAGVAV